MTSLVRSVRWVSVAQASKVISQVVSMLVLSRLLPPSAYGVIAMAGVVTAFVGILRDLGMGAAIIQRKEVTPQLADSVFLFNVLLGLGLGLALLLASPLLGRFFREPALPAVLMLLAVTFPIGSATAVHQAMMERHSRFKELAILDVVTQFSGLAIAIVMAWLGWGVYSLVVPTLFATCTASGWLALKSGWRPGRAWDGRELRSLWGFSGNLWAFNFINYFARNADSMIIGRMLGSAPLGQYGMAYKLMLFPVQNMSWVIGRVLLPRLSLLQDDLVAARDLYFRVLGAIASLAAPLMLGLWALREPFATTLLNRHWDLVPTLLAWLAPVGLMQALMSTIGSLLTSKGRTDALLRLGLFNTATMVVGFVVGGLYGVVWVAAGYFVANLLNLLTTYRFMARALDGRLPDLWRHIGPPMVASAGMATVLVLLTETPQVAALIAPLRLALGVAVGALTYSALMAMVFHRSPFLVLRILKGST